MPSFRGLLAAFALPFLAGHASAASLRMEASTAWAENITRATGAADWRDSFRHELGLSAAEAREWRTGFLTRAEAGVRNTYLASFPHLSSVSAGLNVQARQKFGLGALAPSIAVEAGLWRRDTRFDADDGWVGSLGLTASRRINSAWRAAAGVDWENAWSRRPMFDTRHHRAFGTVAWDVSDRWQVSAGRGRQWGEFTTNASPGAWQRAITGGAGADVAAYYLTTARGPVGAFGPAWVSYRVRGRVDSWWAELAPALGANASLPLRYESFLAENKVGVRYRQDVWTLRYLQRF